MQTADLGLAGERALDFGLEVDASGLRGVEALLLPCSFFGKDFGTLFEARRWCA